jgi:hypothetical protein
MATARRDDRLSGRLWSAKRADVYLGREGERPAA